MSVIGKILQETTDHPVTATNKIRARHQKQLPCYHPSITLFIITILRTTMHPSHKSFSILLSLLVVKLALGFTPSLPTATLLSTKTFSSNTRPLFAKAAAYDEQIAANKDFLLQAAITKCEDPAEVLTALESLEKLMREKRKKEGTKVAQQVLDNLTGEWRLIFTTGTKKTQERTGKINYFPLKAIQAFDATTDPMNIENAIYAGDFALIKFRGDFEFDLNRSKLEFEFDNIAILGFNINLKKGEAAQLGAKTGLGSDSNVKNAEKGKKAFFNWISADDNIATARGGGGGIALWQRVASE